MWVLILVKLELEAVGFCGGRKSGEPNENPQIKGLGKNQQQAQPTFSTGSESSPSHTLVWGEHSHFCTMMSIPDPFELPQHKGSLRWKRNTLWCSSRYPFAQCFLVPFYECLRFNIRIIKHWHSYHWIPKKENLHQEKLVGFTVTKVSTFTCMKLVKT